MRRRVPVACTAHGSEQSKSCAAAVTRVCCVRSAWARPRLMKPGECCQTLDTWLQVRRRGRTARFTRIGLRSTQRLDRVLGEARSIPGRGWLYPEVGCIPGQGTEVSRGGAPHEVSRVGAPLRRALPRFCLCSVAVDCVTHFHFQFTAGSPPNSSLNVAFHPLQFCV